MASLIIPRLYGRINYYYGLKFIDWGGKDVKKIAYDVNTLSDFEREWGVHKRCKEWWYATGILFDDENNMYSYQYTLLHINLGLVTARILMMALTDYRNKKHYYSQTPTFNKNDLTVTEREASFKGKAYAVKDENGMNIKLEHSLFTLDLNASYGKGAFWHCDNGKLQMGLSGEEETTFYYSYTNMPTQGTLTVNGKEIHLKGKTWFDRQGGTYSLHKPQTHWEWFSLRFFDEEEVMLFTFPNSEFNDGTYIPKDGASRRLQDYTIERTAIDEAAGLKWSAGWKLTLEIKEKDYTIEPMQKGHINFAYFEELCYIKDEKGGIAGYCFAELLPGILNDPKKIKISNLFKKIEI